MICPLGWTGRFVDWGIEDQGEHQVQGEPHGMGRPRHAGHCNWRDERQNLGKTFNEATNIS